MARIHLFEFEDQPWFPAFLRDYGTDFLQFLANKTRLYRPILPVLERGLDQCNTSRIVDLGSGGGGSWIWLNSALREQVRGLKIVLTDLFPNQSAFAYTARQADNFEIISEPVNAQAVPENLKGLRTLFLAFHHFRPASARAILQDAVDSGSGIAVFEAQERSVPSILAMLFSPVSVLLTTPFIRPFRWGRILFTYLIPIIPLFVLWDGVVSSLRTYSVPEMEELVTGLQGGDRFDWEIRRLKSGPGVVLYLMGTPKK